MHAIEPAQARAESAARNAPLLDAVFAIAFYERFERLSGLISNLPTIDPNILKARFSEDYLSDADRRVNALLDDAYSMGDALLAQRTTHDAAMRMLQRRHQASPKNATNGR